MSEQRVAVITGGARGIGHACAERLAADGYSLALIDIEAEALAEAVERFRRGGATCVGIRADVSSELDVEAARDCVDQELGRVDVLLNIAGRGAVGRALELTLDSWNTVISSSLTGTFLCSKAFGGVMAEREGGVVVNMSSIMAFRLLPGRAAYAAAKAGIIALTKVTAGEWARFGIRVNAIAPGYIETEMTQVAIDYGVHVPAAIEDRTPQRRMGRPEEVASAVAYLVSDEASFLTGHVLVLDGGYSAFGAWWTTSEDVPGLS